MIGTSPNLYRQEAARKGIKSAIVENAISQAGPPEANGLPAILTLRHLAHITGIDYLYLRRITRREYDPYRIFTIRKRSGGERLIAAPEPPLGVLQRWIVDHILLKRRASTASFAYSRGASPIVCARRHLGARWLVKIDIHDFFESIGERRVYFVFRDCGYQPLIAFELARLCTRISTGDSVHDARWQVPPHRRLDGIPAYATPIMGHLPQGAPTSPLLSNLVSIALDEAILKIANKYQVTYTRYSDDLTFSTGARFSHALSKTMLQDVEHVLLAFGHAVHKKKTRISPPGSRKIVLGLLVDAEKPKLPRNVRKRISDHVRGIEKFGLKSHASNRHFVSIWGMIRHVSGLLSYAHEVDPPFSIALTAQLSKAIHAQGWPSEP
jgi:RNA-directed DNA polymerase